MKRCLSLPLCALLALAITGPTATPVLSGDKTKPADGGKVDKAALKRARREVRMLDDIFKTAIVLITDKYVKTKKDYPAGRAAIRWLRDIGEKGWPEVRLIDVSGEPYTPANVANDDFEKEGVKQLKAGKGYYDRVVHKGGKGYLRAITAIPVVSERCILCHEHYKMAKKGEAVGALTYKVPLE
jgi:hypothetical protein